MVGGLEDAGDLHGVGILRVEASRGPEARAARAAEAAARGGAYGDINAIGADFCKDRAGLVHST